MSKKIEQLLDVIRHVQTYYVDPANNYSVEKLRIDATKSVASDYGVGVTTISDAYIRRLQPQISKTSEFDRVLQNWLRRGTDELREILNIHRLDGDDSRKISQVFGQRPESHNCHSERD